jgi:uncharacterized spore protein YtfJ
MSLNRVFDIVEEARETANWRAAFGEPHVVEGKTIIPVAQVGYGFGLGFGRGTGPAETESEPPTEGEGGGGGAGASTRPLGAIVVTPEHVYFEETLDETRIVLAGIGLAGVVIVQIARTLRAIFGHA